MVEKYISIIDAAKVCSEYGDKLKEDGLYDEAAAVYRAGGAILAATEKHVPGPTIDHWEKAARAKGWAPAVHFGPGLRIWKVSGTPDRVYCSWQDCCIGESIAVPMEHPAEESPR
jgi:hypothetical protein